MILINILDIILRNALIDSMIEIRGSTCIRKISGLLIRT